MNYARDKYCIFQIFIFQQFLTVMFNRAVLAPQTSNRCTPSDPPIKASNELPIRCLKILFAKQILIKCSGIRSGNQHGAYCWARWEQDCPKW